MSVTHCRYKIGNLECGYDMPRKPFWIHLLGVLVIFATLTFSYTALVEQGLYAGIAGFGFGFVSLFFIYGQQFDRFYIHYGNLQIGGEAFATEDNQESQNEIEVKQK